MAKPLSEEEEALVEREKAERFKKISEGIMFAEGAAMLRYQFGVRRMPNGRGCFSIDISNLIDIIELFCKENQVRVISSPVMLHKPTGYDPVAVFTFSYQPV